MPAQGSGPVSPREGSGPARRVALLRQVAEIANISDDFAGAATATLGALTGPHAAFDAGHLQPAPSSDGPIGDARPGAPEPNPNVTQVWVRRRTLSPLLARLEAARADQERVGQVLSGSAEYAVDHSDGGVAWCTHRSVDGAGPWFSRVGVRTLAVVPVTVGRDVVARLELYSTVYLPYDDELTEVLETVGRLLGRVVERQRATDHSRASLSRLRALTESAPEPVIALDSQGAIVEWNQAARDLFGWSSDQIVGRGLQTLASPDLASRYVPNFLLLTAQAKHPVRLGPVELALQHADGSPVPVEAYVGSWEQAGQGFYSVFLRDLRLRKEAEEAIQDRRAALLSQAHAVEINDSVVQGLTMVVYALEAEENDQALHAARSTLRMARTMVRELLAVGSGDDLAEQLLRRKPAEGYVPADRTGDGGRTTGPTAGRDEPHTW